MLISIIIPVYNVAPYIENCLISVFNQTYKNLDIILIDDRSSDNSMFIAGELIKKYPEKKVKIIQHECNRGLSAARNTGINASEGELIFFLDSDDELPYNSIETLYNSLIKYKCEVSVGAFKVVGNTKTDFAKPYKEGLFSYPQNNLFKEYLFQYPACNRLYKSKFIKDNKLFFSEGILHEDILWSYMVAVKLSRFCYVDSETYKYTIRAGSITQNKNQKNIDSLKFIINHISKDLERNPHENFIARQAFLEMLALNCLNDQSKIELDRIPDLLCELRKLIKPNINEKIKLLDLKGLLKQLVYYLPGPFVKGYLFFLFQLIKYYK